MGERTKFSALGDMRVGGNYRGSEFGARAAHGFRGIEKRVVRELAAWIHAVAGARR